MRVIFWYAEKGYEKALAPDLAAGAERHGDRIELRPFDDYRGPEGDAGLICGVVKREIIWDHQRSGHPFVYLDKGYIRARTAWRGMNLPAWWRFVIGDTHPTAYLMDRDRPQDRLFASGMTLRERRLGDHVVIAGSSEKYHHTHGLAHPTEWAAAILTEIRRHSRRHVIYRPKPSWAAAVPIEGAAFHYGGKTSIGETLANAWCVVTHGSIASVDAICAGVPCIVLGNAVGAPISSQSIESIEAPRWLPGPKRRQWAANLSYCHFRPAEIANGTAWGIVKERLNAFVPV